MLCCIIDIIQKIVFGFFENFGYTILSLFFIFFIKKWYFDFLYNFIQKYHIIINVKNLYMKITVSGWDSIRISQFDDNGMTIVLDNNSNCKYNIKNTFISIKDINILFYFILFYYIILFKCMLKIKSIIEHKNITEYDNKEEFNLYNIKVIENIIIRKLNE